MALAAPSPPERSQHRAGHWLTAWVRHQRAFRPGKRWRSSSLRLLPKTYKATQFRRPGRRGKYIAPFLVPLDL